MAATDERSPTLDLQSSVIFEASSEDLHVNGVAQMSPSGVSKSVSCQCIATVLPLAIHL